MIAKTNERHSLNCDGLPELFFEFPDQPRKPLFGERINWRFRHPPRLIQSPFQSLRSFGMGGVNSLGPVAPELHNPRRSVYECRSCHVSYVTAEREKAAETTAFSERGWVYA